VSPAATATADMSMSAVTAAVDHNAAASAAGAVPAEAAAVAEAAFIQTGAIPAVDVKAERNCVDEVQLISRIRRQAEWYRIGARCQRTAGGGGNACRRNDQSFA